MALTGGLVSAAPPPLREIDPGSGCGQTLDIPGEHYVLTGDLECSGPGYGLVIAADNVTLHLAGHTISNSTCDVAYDVIGIYALGGLSGVTIEGGRVSGFNDGVSLSSSNSVVRGMSVTGACYFGILVQADSNLVEKNVVTGSGHGVALAPATNSRVRANDLSGNAVGLLISANDANDNTVEDNIIHNNTEAGVLLANGTRNTVRNNAVNGNQCGISIRSAYNVVQGNTVNGSLSAGIAMTLDGEPSRVQDNIMLGSGVVDRAHEDPTGGTSFSWPNLFLTSTF
jgi:parallel beta-helix repeat protein